MLILQRKKNESIMIGDDIKITIMETGTDKVKLAIDAPKNISIVRTELIEAVNSNKEAAGTEKQTLDNFTKLFHQKSREDKREP